MPTKGFYYGIILTISFVSLLSAWCTHPITCPCGDTRRAIYYTHCINETWEEKITCERWANCKTCKSNVTHCLSCIPERFGPTCTEVKGKRKTCQDPGLPENGNRENPAGADDEFPRSFLERETVHFSCKDDFILVGPSFITCTSAGTWSDFLPKCEKPERAKDPATEKPCKHPGVHANGIIEYPDSIEEDQMFPSTTTLKYKCRDGYKLYGHSVLFCLCSGQWTSDPPICMPEGIDLGSSSVHCEGRGPISNGRVVEYHDLDRQLPSYDEYGALYPVGAHLHYNCNEGYHLRGARAVICESSGLWSAKEPLCIEDSNVVKKPATYDDNISKNSDSNTNNIIRNLISNTRRSKSKHEKDDTDSSNSLTFQFFFL
ncbi:sushi, von Willebrand factor type A, EGF and pentraxin domain-containing protein 1-like [Argiope bruennichi]|uniref:sushi, von Willebrand factor type A, EGF and pentraxin domain-containing protein 1-like n=1 Tax=Argiope bruennichi TaxID=94029 RepID=UPI002494F04B|nr:sushi, von Willebrand factor type A, EGF and pentraxin domain-containing protein 1-like [Argiope bruennichi]